MTFKDVFSELKKYAQPSTTEHSRKIFRATPGEYGEGDKFLGVSVPNQRKVAKKYKHMPLEEVEKLLSNKYHECRSTALLVLVYRIEKATQDEVDKVASFYLKNLNFVDNWDLVDSSCRFILSKFLEYRERDLLYILAKSDNLWEKRISIITCYYFIKKNDFNDALAISEILLFDDHDLIHKAVGWMLREIGEQDIRAEEDFLRQEGRYKQMPRTMLRYAIEKFDEPLRKRYLNGTI